MSNSIRARKVSEPRPVVRGVSSHDSYDASLNGLSAAWDSMGRAKTALRRVERRIDDAERRPVVGVEGSSDARFSDYSVPVDRVPSYRISDARQDHTARVTVDNYGRTQYMRSALGVGTRKVSRLDGKYTDDLGSQDLPERDTYPSKSGTRQHAVSADVLSRVRPHESVPEYLNDHSGLSQDVTDPQARLETDVNFINDISLRRPGYPYDSGSHHRPTKLTHVAVTVPSSAVPLSHVPPYSSGMNTDRAHWTTVDPHEDHHGRVQFRKTHPMRDGGRSARSTEPIGGDPGKIHSDQKMSLEDLTASSNDTYTVGTGIQESKGRKLRRSLRNIDQNSDGLAKLKEKIRQQRMNLPTEAPASNSDFPEKQDEDIGKTTRHDDISKRTQHEDIGKRTQHDDDDPVIPRSYGVYEMDRQQPKVRKIATGPPGPTYKGFTEVETKYRTADGKVVKISDARRKTKSKKVQKMETNRQQEVSKIPAQPEEQKDENRSKKLSRVVASKKKPSKYDRSEIITTKSWREGQKAILRELGPAKLPRVTDSPPTKDKGAIDDSDSMDEDEDQKTDKEERTSEDEKGKVLSKEAQNVLKDLQSASEDDDDDDQEEDGEKLSRSGGKRKRPKHSDTEKQMPVSKVRHYDSDEVRKYIAKQKASRRTKEKEEKMAQEQAAERKKQQLNELYKKQKVTAKVPPPKTKEETKDKSGHEFEKLSNVDELPRRHPFHEDRGGSGGSDKENRGSSGVHQPWSDLSSSDSGTLTADSSGRPTTHRDTAKSKKTERTRPPEGAVQIDKLQAQSGATKKESGISGLGTDSSDKTKKVNTHGLITQITENIGLQPDYRPASSVPLGGSASTGGTVSLPTRPFSASAGVLQTNTGSQQRTRAERIRAIRNTATSLQNRLQSEARRITAEMDIYPRASGVTGAERWAYRRPDVYDDDDYISRQDRITGARDDYTVFSRDLPGIQNVAETARRLADASERNDAATKIQAVFRGHTVRQGMSWSREQPLLDAGNRRTRQTLPLHKDILDDLSEDSVLSDSTITEESEADYGNHRIGTGLRHSAFHTVPKREDTANRFKNTQPHRYDLKHGGSWEESQGDPYSVMNIFARRYKKERVTLPKAKGGEEDDLSLSDVSDTVSEKSVEPPHVREILDRPKSRGSHGRVSPTSQKDELSQSRHSTHSRRSKTPDSYKDNVSKSHHSTSRRTKTPDPDSYKEDFSGGSLSGSQRSLAASRASRTSGKQESGRSSHAASIHSRSKASHRSSKMEKKESESGDDTLEGSITPTLDSDEDKKQKSRVSAGSPVVSAHSKSVVPSVHSLASAKEKDESLESDLSSLGDDQPVQRSLPKTSSSGQPPRIPSIAGGYIAGHQMSPGALERRMAAELHLLEGVDESVRQLTDVERTRAVALAQQETVSLAQLLKGRQQAHDREMHYLQLRAQQDSMEATRNLEDARRRAADAAQNAAQTIAQIKNEATVSIQESTQKLIETQAEAAKATAEAARQLAEAKLATVSQPPALQVHDPQRIATETASAAAAAAVSAALSHQYHYPAKHLAETQDRGTQPALRSYRSPDGSRSDVSSYASESFENTNSKSTRMTTKTKHSEDTSVATEVSQTRPQSARTATSVRSATDISRPGTASSIRTDVTRPQSASSVHTESVPAGPLSPVSKSESILDEVTSEKGDYSMEFDASVTEEEIEEKSFRAVLPSEGHRKKVKKEGSLSDMAASYSSDELHTSVASRRLSLENLSSPSPFGGEDSFNRFTTEMVRQYMREEETRAQHQQALLELRERALKEKTKAELAWLEQQKQRMKDKGADDVYPQSAQIRKKRRGLLLRLQQEQAEIKRLQEANKAASKERQFLLKQSEEISRIRQSTQQVLHKLRSNQKKMDHHWFGSFPFPYQASEVQNQLKGAAGKSDQHRAEANTEDELNVHLDDSRSSSPQKDYKSDSEIYTESNGERGARPSSPNDSRIMKNLKRMKTDQKYLTVREQKLRHRRRNAEELLAWKKRLDEEENKVYSMEKQALDIWEKDKGRDGERKGKAATKAETKRSETSTDKKTTSSEADKTPRSVRTDSTPRTERTDSRTESTPRTARSESIVTDSVKTGSDSSKSRSRTEASVSEDIKTQVSVPEKKHLRSGSESSIADEVVSDAKSGVSAASSIPDEVGSGSQGSSSVVEEVSESLGEKKTQDSSDDTIVNSSVNEEYSNETFESTEHSQPQTQATTKQNVSSGSPKATTKTKVDKPTPKIQEANHVAEKSPKSPKSPFTSPVNRRGSESESEDSFSMTHSETASDQSDVEGRIRALTEELKRRKNEADRLKKEQQKRHKERLKAQEQSLKKQIEAYDNYICQVKTDLQKELEHEPVKGTVKPQIKKPTVGSRRLHKQPEVEVKQQEVKVPELDSSKSGSSFEESKDGGDLYTPPSPNSQASPILAPRDDASQQALTLSPLRAEAVTPTAKRTSLESIDESIETPVSSPSQKKTSTPEPPSPRKPVPQPDTPRSELSEDIPDEVITERSETTAQEESESKFKLNLDLDKKDDEDKKEDKKPQRTPRSARTEISEAIPEDKVPDSARTDASEHMSEARVPRSARSESDIPEDLSVATARSETEKESEKDDIFKKTEKSEKEEAEPAKSPPPREKLSARSLSAKSESVDDFTEDFESDSEARDKSEHSDVSKKSDKSYSYSSAKSKDDQKDYSDDFSESSVKSKSEKVSVSQKSQKSKKSASKGKDESIEDSVETDEDISEQLSSHSDVSEKKSETLFDLKVESAGSGVEAPKEVQGDFEKGESEAVLPTEAPAPVAIEDPLSGFELGDRVMVGDVMSGVLRFKGLTSFAPGYWGGVELDKPEGRNNGTKDGIEYFNCKPNHGIFAPPEKLSKAPKVKEELDLGLDEMKGVLEEEPLSEVSDHTLTEELEEKVKSEGKEKEDAGKKDGGAPELAKEKEEGDESVGEDISVATDSELDRVISSAAAAVEEFDDLDKTPPSSPTDSAPAELELAKQPPARSMDQVVDHITDGITQLIVRDSLSVMSKIADKQASLSPEKLLEKTVENQEPVLKEMKARTPFIGLLSEEQETEEKASEELKGTEKVKEAEPANKSEKAADIATRNLLNEAISQMITIRQKQRERSRSTDSDESLTPPRQAPPSPVTPVTPEDEPAQPQKDLPEPKLLDDNVFLDRVKVESWDDMGQPPRPVSPVFGESVSFKPDELDDLYRDMEGLLGGDDQEWFDDDFGLGRAPHKPPPPYPGSSDSQDGLQRRDVNRMELQRLTEELFYAVPNKKEQVTELVNNAIDVYWEKRRYGESWEGLEPPSEFFTREDRGHDIESNSKRVYKKLLFDLTGEILTDIYKDEEEVEQPQWAKPKRVHHRYHKEKNPPTTSDKLKSIVENHVVEHMGVGGKLRHDPKLNKWGSRKKKDHVDAILVQELCEEEPHWVNYDDDELAVKMQLSDAIFDSLLNDTVQVFTGIAARKSGRLQEV